uniref:adhesion G protein-coupled receptor L4-like n=1 Tax=Styela clava TaxID=7725 RepID=UPI00193ADAE5|nr:adhesion G protein-coupled receptor L4-like [Styela clava]
MDFRIILLIFVFPHTLFVHCLQPDERCEKITKSHHKACELFDYTEDRTLSCSATDGVITEKSQCLGNGCCWHNNTCFKKPVKCYLDFRKERCNIRRGISASGIYEGYSINGSHCFIDNLQSIFESLSNVFAGAVSHYGVRIVGEYGWNKSCVSWIETNSTGYSDGNCTVEFHEGKYDPLDGTIRSDKCVIEVRNRFYTFDVGVSNSCICHMDAWLESKSEKLSISNTIRQYVEKEESRSSCAQILGRLVRDSWKNRLDIVNNAEVGVVVNALLNITNEKVTTNDAAILLDTSEQLSKYKFYEGLENDSANFLIQSSTKILSNLMKTVTSEEDEETLQKRSLEPSALQDVPADSTSYRHSSTKLQWKIMENLEGITDNAASLINLDNYESKYIVSAREETVSLQVAIAKPAYLHELENIPHEVEDKTTSIFQQNARVTDLTDYEKDDDDGNLAVITIFYDLPEKSENKSAINRASDILAINVRSMKDGIIKEKSRSVEFTLKKSSNSCNGTCEDVCVYAEQNGTMYTEKWSDYGCHVNRSEENYTICHCNHTTHFAVLLQPYRGSDGGKDEFSKNDIQNLELISICLGSISVAALAATIIVFIVYRRILLKDRMLIHLHLVIALFCGYISFLAGSMFSDRYFNKPIPCFAFAIASHFFFLSVFFWSLMEGVYLFYKVVMVFSHKWAELSAKYAPVIGWVCPAVIVAISVGVSRILVTSDEIENYDNYYNIHTCFLQQSHGMLWSFMGPILVIILINSVILTKVIFVIFRSSLSSTKNAKASDKEKMSQSLRNATRGALILMPILGIPWIVNVFVELDDSSHKAVVSAYVHVVLMGLQGLGIFLFYCVFNTDVRNAYRLSAERRKSVASITTTTKNRKRSRAPLIALSSKENSPELMRHKYSLSIASTGRTSTASTQVSSDPPSPEVCDTLPPVAEHPC